MKTTSMLSGLLPLNAYAAKSFQDALRGTSTRARFSTSTEGTARALQHRNGFGSLEKDLEHRPCMSALLLPASAAFFCCGARHGAGVQPLFFQEWPYESPHDAVDMLVPPREFLAKNRISPATPFFHVIMLQTAEPTIQVWCWFCQIVSHAKAHTRAGLPFFDAVKYYLNLFDALLIFDALPCFKLCAIELH